MNTNLQKTLYNGMLYGLKVGLPENSDPQEVAKIGKDAVCLGVNTKCIEMWYKTESVKPFLFSLTDLTKEIEFRGQRFVPLVELAKICHPGWPWHILRKYSAHEIYLFIDFDFDQTPEYSFGLEKDTSIINFFSLREGEPRDTRNQQLAIDQLRAWMFNVDGLEEDQYIRITDDNNPYR